MSTETNKNGYTPQEQKLMDAIFGVGWEVKGAEEANKQPFEKYPLLAEHIERMACTGTIGNMSEWNAFLKEINRVL